MKSNQLIFTKGKEKALKTLFSQDNFGYLAIGYQDETQDTNGFENPITDADDDGFNEINVQTFPSYARIPLVAQDEVNVDYDTETVYMKFTADLDIDNIIEITPINQFAIVDSSDSTDPNTVIYAAATFPEFVKSEKIAITFVIDIGL